MKKEFVFKRRYKHEASFSGNHGQYYFNTHPSKDDQINSALERNCLNLPETDHSSFYLWLEEGTLATIQVSDYEHCCFPTDFGKHELSGKEAMYERKVYIEVMPPGEIPTGLTKLLSEKGFKERSPKLTSAK